MVTELRFKAGSAGQEGGVTQPVCGRNRDVITSEPEAPSPALTAVIWYFLYLGTHNSSLTEFENRIR